MDAGWSWLVYALAIWLGMRALLQLTLSSRDRLRGLLVEHYRRAHQERVKRRQIQEMKAKIRSSRAKRVLASAAKTQANLETEGAAAAPATPSKAA